MHHWEQKSSIKIKCLAWLPSIHQSILSNIGSLLWCCRGQLQVASYGGNYTSITDWFTISLHSPYGMSAIRLWHLRWYFVCTRQTHVAVKPLHWSHSKRCMVNTWCPEPSSTRSDQWVQMLNHYCQPITSLSISDATPDPVPGHEQSCHKMIWLNPWLTIFVTASYFKCWLILVCNSQRSHQVLLANL